ncbi:spore germination lipoprotein GerD [Geomicrobium sediminis]|uniref:Spore germination protein D n=1 Tax=Geomicrobium sediminis TaxID=1347788 RepID=A0ABS2PGR2_9BACL|nr:spore germination lipoprotein GerD [Geomicrobium sediminis]MBM7634623.1 spore germination protein D [Geomicrobium sediminis]
MQKHLSILIVFTMALLLTGCAAYQGEAQADYDETKRMVADVIKTEEGKQALREVLTEEEFQTSLVMEQSFVQDTIHDTLTSEEGKAFWGQLIDDPKFGVKVADSMQTKNEEVLKRLMKDPDYQTMMMEVMHDPEMEQATLELMKSKEFREQIMTVIEESMQNPRFQASLQKIASESGGSSESEEGNDRESSSEDENSNESEEE